MKMGQPSLMSLFASGTEFCRSPVLAGRLVADLRRDCNTRFSGVVEKDLDSAAMDLGAVRKAACSFIGPKTIIVGHGYASTSNRYSANIQSRERSARTPSPPRPRYRYSHRKRQISRARLNNLSFSPTRMGHHIDELYVTCKLTTPPHCWAI